MSEQLLWIALATLVSEDLACIAAGALVAQGKLAFAPATLACLAGIYAGDLLLFLAGRFARKPALRLAPEEKIRRASDWISRRGMAVVFLSRFAPGLRLPVYVAAGVLRTPFRRFAAYFLLAAAIWTPLLVGAAALSSEGALRFAGPAALAAAFFVAPRMRWTWVHRLRWEFWPMWAAYAPLAPYLLYLACKHRSLTLFTAANPGIPSGGFAGESKSEILKHLGAAAAPFERLGPGAVERAAAFAVRHGYPVVIKPDVGERGTGVAIVRDRSQLESYLRGSAGEVIVQRYVPGLEFGVFYCRYPDQPRGRVLSITRKRFPSITGDGRSTVRELILKDNRAACLAPVYLKSVRRNAGDVPAPGEKVPLVEVGSHCRGAIFLDAANLNTPALERAIDAIAQSHPGFYFGRFDLRVPSDEALREGRDIQILELNGVSAEATHVYDPAVSLIEAYRTLAAQWRIAFEIGAINRTRDARPMPLRDLLRTVGPAVLPASPLSSGLHRREAATQC